MGSFRFLVMLLLLIVVSSFSVASAGDFHQEFDLTWGDQRAQILNGGKLLMLTLDKASGSGFRSKREYLFGRIDMQIKLVAGNSTGTVTAFYLSSEGPNHDEIDFEFLGNLSGDPYIVHTKVTGNNNSTYGSTRQRISTPIRLFGTSNGLCKIKCHNPLIRKVLSLFQDMSCRHHEHNTIRNNYILCSRYQHGTTRGSDSTLSVGRLCKLISFLVDNIPIRVFNNEESFGVPFPKNQPMRMYSSLWDADDWATRGGLVKTDWSKAPFKAYYQNFNANACTWSNGKSDCASQILNSARNNVWQTKALDASGRRRLRWVQRYFMVYNYCADLKRFPQGRPRECRHSRFL